MKRIASRPAIHELPFRHSRLAGRNGIDFEMFRLSELFARADRGTLDHSLESPVRLGFHIVYVGLRGRGQVVVDFAPVRLGAGYLTVVARGRVQQFTRERGVDAWMLMFSPELIAPAGEPRAIDPLRGAALLSPSRPAPALPLAGAAQRDVLELCRQLAAEQERPFDAQRGALLAALVRAVLLRAERLASSSAPDCSPMPPTLERFYAAVERDHVETRAVAHYARVAGVSSRRLAELLKARGRRTPKQVIGDRVALEQKRLLAHTDLSVKELAARTGFREPTNLVKFFRQQTGTTPLAFRQGVRAFSPSARRS
jgi:AraC-like DNA-binding protein